MKTAASAKPKAIAAKAEKKDAPKKEPEAKKEPRPKAEIPKHPAELAAQERCLKYVEPGQARKRAGSGSHTCTRILTASTGPREPVAMAPPPSPPEAPARELRPLDARQLPETVAPQIEDWRVKPADVAALAEDRAKECLAGLCHARHPGFVPKEKKPGGQREGQSHSTGGNAGTPKGGGNGTTVKTRPRPFGKTKAAPKDAPKPTKVAPKERRVPNPNGRRGDQKHQGKIKQIVEDIKNRKLTPDTEYRVETPGGHKKNRYMDVVGLDKNGNPVEMHQVGRQTKGGVPVSRERKALDDVEGAGYPRPTFHPTNETK